MNVAASTLTDDDKGRLNAQCGQILDRLSRGPATNEELSQIALKYTSRISDLRKRGHRIDCTRQGRGLTRYSLMTPQSIDLLEGAA